MLMSTAERTALTTRKPLPLTGAISYLLQLIKSAGSWTGSGHAFTGRMRPVLPRSIMNTLMRGWKKERSFDPGWSLVMFTAGCFLLLLRWVSLEA